jgi:2'-5' RNA ligase
MPFRAFISVDLPRMKEVEDLIDDLKIADPTLKVVDPTLIHVTLKFLGDTDESKVKDIGDAMRKATEGITPFEVRLTGAGAFPSENRIRVVWVGMNDTLPMGMMASRLDEDLADLGIERERRPFAPHLTVARARSEAPSPAVRQVIENNLHLDFGVFRVDRIRLKKSILTRCGPQYSTVEEVLLEGEEALV